MRKALTIPFFVMSAFLVFAMLHKAAAQEIGTNDQADLLEDAPSAPAGFIASDMIGDNPVQPGEIFLAVGPNDVEQENIEYRLFYSTTADAPSDPQDATEYEFGTTPGDGDGVNPFGFVVTELAEGTEHTFWLYQYDNVSDTFSEPAEASAVSGGEGDDPPPPVGDNVLFNGDFEDALDFWTPFIADFAGVSADIDVVDGEAAITNIMGAGGEVWHVQFNQEFTQEQIDALEVGQTYIAQFDARSNVEGRQLRLYFGEDGGGFTPVNISDFELSTSMETYEVTFEVPATYGAMKFGFEMGLSNDDVYIDNVSLTLSDETPPPTGPPAPEGFVASNMIGENPVEDGEIFLAAGPNNVEEEDIEYRLFYSTTADAPGDPTTATEYEFGTTPGDGEGNAAFGFVIGDLNPGTEYTFWLYQYDTDEDLFSEPAEASAVSGGEDDDPPPPVGDNIIFNGDFEDGLDFWEPFIADFEGVSADISVVNGEAAITNIEGAGGEIWYVQLNQILTEEQIASLEVGAIYTAQFDARSNVDGRQLRMFFGEDGGDFAPLEISDYTLSTEMETYEATVEITTTFSTMKLGFEMGLSNDDVYIDNVSLTLSDETPPPTGPPAPEGFVASNMIGENPVEDGEIFLAAGPNNVEEENIEYRLFYSTTADAPDDPQDATEYEFGTTPGDGDGVGPFGFVVTDLAEGTDHTFWLYQYNTAEDLFSEPAEASAVSGGEGEPAPEVAIPITFEEDIDWGSVIVDFDGGETTVIDNPDPSGINTSATVAQMVKGEGQPWAGSYIQLSEAVETGEAPIDIQVWAPRDNTTLLFKIENSDNPDLFYEVEQTIPASGEWTELSFDMSGADSSVEYDVIVLIFDLGTVGDGSADFTWFFDNIEYGEPTSTGDELSGVPDTYELNQNYPNPFNPTTQIQFAVPEAGQVQLDVYNVMGQRVATLVNETMSAGTHTATFDGTSLASGVYVYRLRAGNTVLTRKMMLVK